MERLFYAKDFEAGKKCLTARQGNGQAFQYLKKIQKQIDGCTRVRLHRVSVWKTLKTNL